MFQIKTSKMGCLKKRT